MTARPRSPQEKKRLALERDRVDQWGENQKAARRNIPKKKALLSRAHRKAVSQGLATATDPDEIAVRRKSLRKWSGPTLGVALQGRCARREATEAMPRKSPEARQRRRALRGSSR